MQDDSPRRAAKIGEPGYTSIFLPTHTGQNKGQTTTIPRSSDAAIQARIRFCSLARSIKSFLTRAFKANSRLSPIGVPFIDVRVYLAESSIQRTTDVIRQLDERHRLATENRSVVPEPP